MEHRGAGKNLHPAPSNARSIPYTVTQKARIYSENRIKYPMKRVDFDPNGNRNQQNRGKSGYVRISLG